MQVRPILPAEARAFQTLRLEALRECPSAFASSLEEECDTPMAVIADRLTPGPDRCVLGAFHESGLIGMVGIQRERERKLSHKAFIWGMYVAPSARHAGAGRALVQAALAHAASMPGVRQVNLGVNAANVPAIALYRSMGFTSFGVERGFLLLNGELHDEILMVRQILSSTCLQVEPPPL